VITEFQHVRFEPWSFKDGWNCFDSDGIEVGHIAKRESGIFFVPRMRQDSFTADQLTDIASFLRELNQERGK